jgi:hypothetical protein
MQTAATKLTDLNELQSHDAIGFRVGQIVRITKEGRAVVDYPDNTAGPVETRSVVDSQSKHHKSSEESIPVLLAFERGDPTLPIIVGIIHDTLYPKFPSQEIALPIQRPRDAILDGKKIVFDAKEEIVLRCGKSSVTLKKDGKVVVKGTQIISRASAINNIKGASVRIN